jgi:hypothetical protein
VTVDEMDLVSQALEAAPWTPEAYERARTTLRGAMAEPAPPREAAPLAAVAPVRGRGFPRAGNRRRRALGARGKAGIGAGIGAVAAAVAVLLATTSAQPAAPAGSSSHPQATVVTSKLVTLAAQIKASGASQPGNASLVINDQVIGGKLMQVLYGLYTDRGAMYSGDDKKTLMTAVGHHANLADGTNVREIAAARYAATGDLATARKRMVNALPNDFFLSFAARKKIWEKGAPARNALMREKGMKTPLKMPTGKALQEDINNNLWTGCTIALAWAGGNPQIREGVLRLVSTIPAVTVVNSRTGGQPTLTLTAGPAVFGGTGKQVLTISARTGMPISSWVGDLGPRTPPSLETYRVSRVTLASVKSGRF